MTVVFEDEQENTNIGPRVVENHEFPYLARVMIGFHLAKDEKSAYAAMVLISLLCLLLSGIFFSISFVRRTDNYFDEGRTTGTYNPKGVSAPSDTQ